MSNPENNNFKYITELMKAGSEITGSAIGASIGYLISGLDGAIIGGASVPVVKNTFLYLASEIKNRMIGKREEIRIGATLAFAVQKILKNSENGLILRQDDFFGEKIDDRSPADEIVEGVLTTAQREYQEKKLQFYGNLIANIAFHPEIDREQANFLIKLSENLSYRQLCLLNLFANKDKYNLRDGTFKKGIIGAKKILLLQEIYDLISYGILHCSDKVILSTIDIEPAKMKVQGGAGALLYNLMNLETANTQEISQIAELLK